MQETYTKALLELLKNGTELQTVAEGFYRVLKERGHEQLAAPVWRSVLRILRSRSTGNSVVYLANAADYDSYVSEIQSILGQYETGSEPEVSVDPTLIGGYIVEANSQRIDRSYKTQLVNLYRKVTT